MNWTTEKPTTPGFYWLRWQWPNTAPTFEVMRLYAGKNGGLIVHNDDEDYPLDEIRAPAHWYGPVAPPEFAP